MMINAAHMGGPKTQRSEPKTQRSGPKTQQSGPKAHQTHPEGLEFEGWVLPTHFSIYRHPTIVLLLDPLQELPADEDHEQDATVVVDIPVSPKHL